MNGGEAFVYVQRMYPWIDAQNAPPELIEKLFFSLDVKLEERKLWRAEWVVARDNSKGQSDEKV